MGDADRLKDLAWMATQCGDAAEFRAQALVWVDRAIGVDAAILVELDRGTITARTGMGPDPAWIDRFLAGLGTHYRRDFESILASLDGGSFMTGPMSRLDRWAALPDRQGLEEELMFPLGLRIGSGGLVATRGAPNGVLLLARMGRARVFNAAEAALLDAAAPILSLGLTLHRRAAPPAPRPPAPRRAVAPRVLTPRERTIVEYVILGLSSREIGLALGTSPNTVRNQLASIFQKLSVASRAELVAVAFQEGLAARDRSGVTSE